MRELGRREFIKYALIGSLSATTVLLEIFSSSSTTAIDHPIKTGFSFSVDEAETWLGFPGIYLFGQLGASFDTSDLPIKNWVRLCLRQNKKDYDNLKELEFQYRIAERYGLDIYQTIGADQPFYPNRFAPNDMSFLDPDYDDLCMKANEHSIRLLDKYGYMSRIKRIFLGNESRARFTERSQPFSSIRVLRHLKDLVKPYGITTIMNDFCENSLVASPQSWEECQMLANEVAINAFPQQYGHKTNIRGALSRIDQLIQASSRPTLFGELQSYDWAPGVFTTEEQKMFLLEAARRADRLGIWEADKCKTLSLKDMDHTHWQVIEWFLNWATAHNAKFAA